MRHLKLSAWIVPVAISIIAVLPSTGLAAERCVLGEYFTQIG